MHIQQSEMKFHRAKPANVHLEEVSFEIKEKISSSLLR